MKKVININFQGQVIAIEEAAYEALNQYIDSLQDYFSREEGGDEIVNDIECRIAELFGNRLKHGIPCITEEDVEAIIASIGRPRDFDTDYEEAPVPEPEAESEGQRAESNYGTASAPEPPRRLYRNSNDQIIAGVCSGLAHYFKADPVWIRILFVLLFGLLFWVYILLWIVLRSSPLDSNVTKRFYRNPNDRVLGGVCGGLAAYFKIDSWIPRVLFLLPLVLNVIGMVSFFPLNWFFDNVDFNWNINMSMAVVYLVLWIIIPQAKTVKQKLEMMGEEEYIQSIRDRVSDNVSGNKSRAYNSAPATGSRPVYSTATTPGDEGYAPAGMESRVRENVRPETESAEPRYKERVSGEMEEAALEDESSARPGLEGTPPQPPVSTPPPVDSRDRVSPQTERSGCLNLLVILLKIVFFTAVGIIALVLLATFVAFLFAGAHLVPLKSLFVDPGYESHLLIISLCLLVLVPMISIVTWIARRATRAKSRPVIGIVASILWIGGLVTTGLLAARMANKFNVESSSETTVSITPVTASKMYVEMLPYGDDYAEFKVGYGPGSRIDDLPYITIEEDSLLFNTINLQVRNSTDSLFHVRTIAASRGRNLRAAKADIAQFSYPILQNDSVLFLPEFLRVPIEQGYRNQSITVEIAVPVGKSVEVSDALNDYKNSAPPAVVRKRIRNFSRTYNPGNGVTGEQPSATLTNDTV